MSFTLNLLYILKWFGLENKPWPYAFAVLYLLAVTSGVLCIFRKAGKRPWHALIPFYGSFELFSIAWRGWIGLVYRALSISAFLLLPESTHLFVEGVQGILCFLALITSIVLSLILKAKMSRSFGRGAAFSFALTFAEGICAIVLGYGRAEYLGPTLIRSNSYRKRRQSGVSSPAKVAKHYMINLYKWRSVAALIACIVTLFFSVNAINWGITSYMSEGTSVLSLFCYFTIVSNCLTALGSSFVLPYAVDGIHRKRFIYPKWVAMFHYAGTICTTLTMVFAVLVISWFNPDFAFGRYNFWLHLICPVAVLVSFFMVESSYRYSLDDTFICMIPFFIYSLFYLAFVVLIGEENGGWEDMYYAATFTPITLSLPLMYFLAFAVAFLIRAGYNRLSCYRQEKLTAAWSNDAEPVEIKVEAFGLGRYDGKHGESNSINMPLEILEAMSEKYSLSMDELLRAYSKGVTGGLKEREMYRIKRREEITHLLGTPEKSS